MLLYQYDENTKEYIGYTEAYIDPLESIVQGKDIYLYPPCTTEQVPPELKEGYIILYNEEEDRWEEFEDHRGTIVWTKQGEEVLMDMLGPIPSEYLLEKPVTLKELKDEKLKEIKEAYISEYIKRIEVKGIEVNIDDSVKLGDYLRTFRSFGSFSFEDKIVSIEDAEEIVKFLYIRSMLLLKKKEELIKEVMSLRGKEKTKEFEVDFSLDTGEYLGMSIEELREKFSK